jgi:hypothetical protein
MSYYNKEEKPKTALERRAEKEGTFLMRSPDEIQPIEVGFTALAIFADVIDIPDMLAMKTLKATNKKLVAAGQVPIKATEKFLTKKGVLNSMVTQLAIGFGILFGTGKYKELETDELVLESSAIVAAAVINTVLMFLGPIGWVIIIAGIIGSLIDLFFNPFAVMKNRDLNKIRSEYIKHYMKGFTDMGMFYPLIIHPNYLDVDDDRQLTPQTKKLFFEYFNEWLRLNGYVNQEDMNKIMNENLRNTKRLEQRVQYLSTTVDSPVIPIRVVDKSVLLLSGFNEDDIDNYTVLMSLVARRKRFELEATRSKEYEFFVRLLSDGNFITKLSVNLIFYFILTLILLY